MVSAVIYYLSCQSITIGSWARVAENEIDLIIFYSPDKCRMVYYIKTEQAGYRIEYPFASIKDIFLDTNESGITIELFNVLYFFIDPSDATNRGFYQSSDFHRRSASFARKDAPPWRKSQRFEGPVGEVYDLGGFHSPPHSNPPQSPPRVPTSQRSPDTGWGAQFHN